MVTAKLIISWKCNLDCDYCCNKQSELRDTFTPISLQDISLLKVRDIEITGGEPLMPCNMPILRKVLKCINPTVNKYLYTNGVYLNWQTLQWLVQTDIKGINIGYHHPSDLDWTELNMICKYFPLRLWVNEYEIDYVRDKTDIPIRIWKIGDCDIINTERYVLKGAIYG